MIKTRDHLKTLEKARDQLLAQRQSLAEALAGGYKTGQTENFIERIVNVQAAIDVISAAISQEHLASRVCAARRPMAIASQAQKGRPWL
jgi:hypothetical protein